MLISLLLNLDTALPEAGCSPEYSEKSALPAVGI